MLRLNLESYADDEAAKKMEQYLRNQFSFVGIAATKRKELIKPLLKESKTWSVTTMLEEVQFYYNQEEREYQYIAIALLEKNYKRIEWEQWQTIVFPLITIKPWWDTIDSLKNPISLYLLGNPEKLEEFVYTYMKSPSLWERRIAILIQLKYKEQTRTDLLAEVILETYQDNQFFIQKAIGWILREYSKTNPDWVRIFIQEHDLSKLATTEGSKFL